MKQSGIEFLLKLKDKLTAPLKNIQKMKDDLKKGVTIDFKGKNINELNSHMEKMVALRNSANDTASIKRYNAEIDRTQGKIDKLSNSRSSIGKLFDSAKGFVAAQAITALTTGFVAYGKEAVASFDTAAKANAQMEAVILSTGGSAGRSLQQLSKQAEDLAGKTLFDDDQTKGAQNLLLTFTEIKGKVFDDAIPAIQDLATAMSGDGPVDLKGASVQVGKALNDPIKGISALSRVGVTFTEQQKNVIENLVNTGQKAKAQGIILAELNKEFGGSAEAAALAGLGPLQVLNNKFGEIKESIGGLIVGGLLALMPVFSLLETAMSGVVSGLSALFEWIGKNKDLISDIGIVIGIGAIALGLYAIAINGVVWAKTAWAAITGGLTTAFAALNAMMAANPIGAIIIGVTALIAIFIYFYETTETVRGAAKALWEGLKFYFMNIAKLTMDIWGNIGKIIKSALTLDADGLSSGVSGLKSAFANFGDGLSTSMSNGYAKGVKEIQDKNEAKKLEEKVAPKKKGFVDFNNLEGLDDTKSKKSKKDSLSDRADSISGDAKSQRNITINNNKELVSIRIDKVMSDKSLPNLVDEVNRIVEEGILRMIRNVAVTA